MALLQNVIQRGTHASRPAAGSAGIQYFETDTGQLFRDNGSSWDLDDTTLLYTAKGQILASSASAAVGALAAGTNGYVLTADSTQTLGIKWAAASGSYTDPLTTRGDLVVRGASSTTRLALGSSGQYLKSDGTDAAWAAGASGALTQISDQTVSGSVAASITFGSLGSYNHLQLLVQARGDTAANNTRLKMQVNSDTTSGHYQWEYAEFYAGNTTNGAENTSTTSLDLGAICANTSPASSPGQSTIMLPNYAGTTWHKSVTAQYGYRTNTGGSATLTGQALGFWLSTAAITSLLVFPAAGNFAIGSRFTLYGWT